MSSKCDIRFINLDGRYSGYRYFDHLAEITMSPGYNYKKVDRLIYFNEVRDWCNATWGTSMERDEYIMLRQLPQPIGYKLNPHWAYHVKAYELRIYLATDKELAWLDMRWK